jgi:hypothetical protein
MIDSAIRLPALSKKVFANMAGSKRFERMKMNTTAANQPMVDP